MALEQAGVHARVCDESIGATYRIGIGTGLQVRARDEEAALAILRADPVSVSASQWSELPNDVVESADAVAASPREHVTPPKEMPSTGDGPRPRALETLELVGVLLVTCAYPILSPLLGERTLQPTRPGQLMADVLWSTGLTLMVWTLLRRGQGRLSPEPLPGSVSQWARELFIGFMLFLSLWVIYPALTEFLRRVGVPDAPDPASRWASFFRQPGIAAVYPVETFFSAVYEEVAFRAYLVSRLTPLLGKRRAWPVLVAAALFALTHGYPPLWTLSVFVDGVVFGFVYLASRSLPRLVVAHWLHNLAVMNHYLHAG
jgi:membrane protease YdiL (CAAX protease family)